MIYNSPAGACLVEYETPEEARRALHESGFYKGKTFIVQSGTAVEREKSLRDDPSVQAELDIMSGGASGTQNINNKTTPAPPTRHNQPTAMKSNTGTGQRPQLPLFQGALAAFKKKPLSASESTMVVPQPPSSPVMIHKMSVPELQKLIAMPAFSTEQK